MIPFTPGHINVFSQNGYTVNLIFNSHAKCRFNGVHSTKKQQIWAGIYWSSANFKSNTEI